MLKDLETHSWHLTDIQVWFSFLNCDVYVSLSVFKCYFTFVFLCCLCRFIYNFLIF